MTYEEETKQIKENKKSDKASVRHKFKPAKWTHPNGHPRCLICGDEERVGGFCEPLMKGSLQRKHPFNPQDVDEDERFATESWTIGQDLYDNRRDKVPAMTGNDRVRALHRLHSVAPSRRNPDTGEREFLLHRGQTHADIESGELGDSGYASFTPMPMRAIGFAKEGVDNLLDNLGDLFDNGTHPFLHTIKDFSDDMDRVKSAAKQHFGKVFSAWVPESAIHSIPNQWGSVLYENINDKKGVPGPQYRNDEHEVIVKTPGLKFHEINSAYNMDHVIKAHKKFQNTMAGTPPVPAIQRLRVVKTEIELWAERRVKNVPSVKDLIKGQNGDWQKEGYDVSIDHESTWQPKKGLTEYHVVARSPAGKEVGRYTFHHDDNGLKADTARTDDLHQRKGLAAEAYSLIQRHTGLKVQPGQTQLPAGKAMYANPASPFGKSESYTLEHYSHQPDLEQIDPKFHGTGVKGEESKRKRNPDWVDRSYHYLAGTTPEANVGALPHKYLSQVPVNKVYDYQKDPDKLKQKSMWGSSLDRNLYEKNIKEAGYHGYINHGAPGMGSVVALFHPVDVHHISKSEDLIKAIDSDEYHNTLDSGKSQMGHHLVDVTPHVNLKPEHAQYVKDLHDPKVKMPSGMYDNGVSPKMVHEMPYGTFMIKPFHEDTTDLSGLATVTAKKAYEAGGIGHLNEDISVTHLKHPDNEHHSLPVVISKFHPEALQMNHVSPDAVNPKEAGQIAIMDYLMGNQDRHSGNSMVQMNAPDEQKFLSPLAIDHGFSFAYSEGHKLKNMIKDSYNYDGFGQVVKKMTKEDHNDLAAWYRDHGDKIHNSITDSINSIKDDSVREIIRKNVLDRHNALSNWADGHIKFGDVEVPKHPYLYTKSTPIVNELHAFTNKNNGLKSKEDLDKVFGLYQKYSPAGTPRSHFIEALGMNVRGINADVLSNYLTEPVDHRSDFKNALIHSILSQRVIQHPQIAKLVTQLLDRNRQHPDHAKPLYPFTQKLLENRIKQTNGST